LKKTVRQKSFTNNFMHGWERKMGGESYEKLLFPASLLSIPLWEH
jgi:hypothetical protein